MKIAPSHKSVKNVHSRTHKLTLDEYAIKAALAQVGAEIMGVDISAQHVSWSVMLYQNSTSTGHVFESKIEIVEDLEKLPMEGPA